MMNKLAHSFNIKLEKTLIKKLKTEQKKLAKIFKELRFYDSSPHLAIATKFTTHNRTNLLIGNLKKEFENDQTWTLGFSGFFCQRMVNSFF